ncbi:MAG: transposase, partial [Anaerolineae bacterium]|nr:transposase [Anaerolineae bacterium]
MTTFTMFCEIAEEEERVIPALLIPLETYAQEIGFFDHLEHLQLDMKEVKHTVRDKAVTQILNIAIGSAYNKDIDTELRPERQAANTVGQEQFPDQSGINRFLRRFTPLQIEDLALIHGLTLRQYGEARQAEVLIVDLDGFGLLAKRKRGLDFREFDFVFRGRGHVFARQGYFAHYPGKEGYHVFAAYTGQYGEVIAHLLDPGNVSPRSRFYDLYYQILENLDHPEVRLLFRFDGGITSGEIIEFLIDEGHLVISKGNNSRTSRRLARRANNDAWEWVSPNQQANDLGWIKIPHCRHRVRVILLRTFRGGKVEYSHLILNIPAEVLSVKEAVDLYNARQTMESMIKESRRVLWIGHHLRKLKLASDTCLAGPS